MDSFDLWAIRIAEEVAPDEVDLAPVMARAFVRGGRDRKDLFRQPKESVPGAFGPELVTALFPLILETIEDVQNAGPALSEFFTTTKDAWAGANSFIGVLNLLLTIGSRTERTKKAETLPDDPYGPLKDAITVMSQELESSGVPPDQSDVIILRVLRRMLEDPSGAAEFVEKVGKASPNRP
jgi:hypothetical protein